MPEPSPLEVAYRNFAASCPEVLDDLLNQTGVFKANNANDIVPLARNEGRRWVGIYLLHMIGQVTEITTDRR